MIDASRVAVIKKGFWRYFCAVSGRLMKRIPLDEQTYSG